MGDWDLPARLEYCSISGILVGMSMKSKLLKTYAPSSWENIIIITRLPLNQVCNQCWGVMNIDYKCNSSCAAILDLCTKDANACSGLNSFVRDFQGNTLCNIPV